MSISLYDVSISNYLQTLGAVAGFLDRGLSHCRDNNIDPQELVDTRLFADMLPLSFQIYSVHHHSLHAVESLKSGVFLPPSDLPTLDYAGWQALVAKTIEDLKAFKPEDVNALGGGDVAFDFRGFKMPFTAENFIMSFSLPNFHFHAATAYDILRQKGVPLGKRDYMGPLRLKA